MSCFTFVASEKNGSGSYTESYQVNSKDGLKQFWESFSQRCDKIFGRWFYQVLEEDGEEISDEVRLWFSELEIEIEE